MPRLLPSLSSWPVALLLCAGTALAGADAPGRWSTLTPLIAGTYGGGAAGTCTATPQSDVATGTIRVTADGKVRAPGIDIDVADSPIAHIERSRTASGFATSVALVGEGTTLAIGQVEGQALAQARAGGNTFFCDGVRLPTALARQSLALTFAPMLEAKTTISCSATPDGKQSPLPFALARGRASLGPHVLELARASDERLIRGPDGVLKYEAQLPDGRSFIVHYGDSGKVAAVVILDRGKDVMGCEVDD